MSGRAKTQWCTHATGETTGGDEAHDAEGEQVVAAVGQARGLPGDDDDDTDGQYQPDDR